MKQKWEDLFELEVLELKRQRFLQQRPNKNMKKFFDVISAIFLFTGFLALVASFFTKITLLDATCLFVISYVIQPSDLEIAEEQLKGIAEDLANIRLNTVISSKIISSEKAYSSQKDD